MTQRRIRVPRDIAILGYDDIDFAAAAAVPLSSVRQPREQLGRAAAELLLEEANRPDRHEHRHVLFQPELVVRESTAARRPRPAPAVLMRIALFITCLADALFPRVGQATVTLLERLGHEVVFPPAQTCCGQMHVNTGYLRGAAAVVRHHVDVFSSSDVDASWRRPGPAWARSATSTPWSPARRAPPWPSGPTALAARTYELSEFLVDVLGVDRRRRVLPAPGHLPPDLPLAADAARR